MQKKHYLFLTLLSFGTTLFAFGCQRYSSMEETPDQMMEMKKPEEPPKEEPPKEEPPKEEPEEPISYPTIQQVRKNWPTQVCSSLGSISGTACFENPRIGTSDVQSVSGLRSDYVWMVGGGNIWNSDGTDAWLAYHEDGLNLYGVYARDEGAAWAVGAKGDQGVILLWDGNKWSSYEGTCLEDNKKKCNSSEVQGQLKRKILKSVHGTKTGAVWIAATDEDVSGTHGFLYQVTGRKKIQRVKSAPNTLGLQGLFVLDEKHVWAVGDAGRVLFFDGMAWSSISTTTEMALRNMLAVWASSPTDVWVVGGPDIWHFDGTAWKRSATFEWMYAVWGTGEKDVWAIDRRKVVHFNGSVWETLTANPRASYYNIWGTSSNNVWVGGDKGTIFQWDGTKLTAPSFGAALKVEEVKNFGGTDSEVLLLENSNKILSNKTNNWIVSAIPNADSMTADNTRLNSLWGADANNIWVVGDLGLMYRWNGTIWSKETIPVDARSNVTSISGSSTTNIWGVTRTNYLYFDGMSWRSSSVFGRNYFNAVAVRDASASASRAWAVGNGITLLTYDTTATPRLSATNLFETMNSLRGVWVLNDNNAWAVGDAGTIYRWNGTTWSLITSGTTENLNGVWGRSATDVWAVGAKGTILHFDGSRWSSVSINLGKNIYGTDAYLTSVWGNTKGVWTAGNRYILQLKRP